MEKEIIYDGKFLRVVRKETWEYVERTTGKDVAYIVPIAVNKFGEPCAVFIKEYRIPFEQFVVGFPAGLVGDINKDEAIIESAYRELEEETGYSAKRMRYLVSGPPSSGLSDETVHIYLADKLTKINNGGGVDGENITVHVVPLHKAENWLYDMEQHNCIIDIKVYTGLYFAIIWI